MPILRKWFEKIRWQYVVEIALMIVLGWHASWQYSDWDQSVHLGGLEVENLTLSAHYLDYSLHTYGYVPWWQPFSNEGQPLMDESVSIIANPVNFFAVVLFGADNGIKLSVILSFMIAGVGGWFLAQSLGMGVIGRVLLGALLVVKGSMSAQFGAGSFQLGVPQAYFPWIMAGTLAVVRGVPRRWPPVLMAVAYALMFFTTELYYTLPILILVGFCFAFYAVRLRFEPFQVQVDRATLRRFLFAGALTAGLIAFTALPIGLTYWLQGRHASMMQLPETDVGMALYQFIYPQMLFKGLFSEDLYSYVIPLWFLALIFVFIPPIRGLHRSKDPKKDKPLWWIGGFGFLFFLVWGLGLRPIVPWIYEHIPLIGQWRFPDRMLGIATFLLVFLIAFRADGLFRAVTINIRYTGKRTGKPARILVAASVMVAVAAALVDHYQNYLRWGYLSTKDPFAHECVQWLRQQYPGEFINIQRRDFITLATFIRQGARMSDIAADYYINGVPSTIYSSFDFGSLPAPFYMPAWDQGVKGLQDFGLVPIEGSPSVTPQFPTIPCVWRNPNAPTYAFSVPLGDLQTATEPITVDQMTPVTFLGRTPEHISLEAQPDPNRVTVVVAQDVAYPGWTVLVDGEPAKLESVGRMLGVQLLPGTTPRHIEFIFTAPLLKLGGVITVITVFGSVFYLLHGERLIAWWRRRAWRSWQRPARIENPLRRRTLTPTPDQAPIPTVPIPVPALQPATVASPLMPQAYTNGHAVGQAVNGTHYVHVEAETGVKLTLPPSDKPYYVEVVAPTNRNQIVTRVSLAGVIVVLAYLVVAQTRRSKP